MCIRVLMTCCWCTVLAFYPDQPATPRPAPRQAAAPAARARPADRSAARTLRLLAALRRPCPVVSFDQVPLQDALAWIQAQGIDNIMVKWKTIEQTGAVDRARPVSLQLEDLTVGEVLDMILDQASLPAATLDQELTYHVFDGLLIISTRGDFDQTVVTRTYPVAHLLNRVTLNELAPYLAIGNQVSVGGATGAQVAPGSAALGGGSRPIHSGVVFGPGDPGTRMPDFDEEHAEELANLIELLQSIRPETWKGNGGRGSIDAFGDRLVISQTIEMHEIIGGAYVPE